MVDNGHEQSLPQMKMRLRGMLTLLILQYILGMSVNIFSFAPEDLKDNPSTIGTILMGIHGILGLFLFIGSVLIFINSLKKNDSSWKKWGLLGFTGILVSFVGGLVTVALPGDVSIVGNLTMSLGFLLAFVSYGMFWYLLKEK